MKRLNLRQELEAYEEWLRSNPDQNPLGERSVVLNRCIRHWEIHERRVQADGKLSHVQLTKIIVLTHDGSSLLQ